MKFNVTFQVPVQDKKGKTEPRQITIEAPDMALAQEWGTRQIIQWGEPSMPFEVAPFVKEKEEVQETEEA